MQGELGDSIQGAPGVQGPRGERGTPGPVIDATGTEVISVKGEKVTTVLLKLLRSR